MGSITSAQSVYEPISYSVYKFLERLEGKSIIQYNSNLLPLTRIEISDLLQKADSNQTELTQLEKEELQFYEAEFGYELNKNEAAKETTLFSKDNYNRFRIFSYQDKAFSLSIDPILGWDQYWVKDIPNFHRRNGLRAYGYIRDNFGFSLQWYDNLEEGDKFDFSKAFTPERGVNWRDNIDYSMLNAAFNYDWSWGRISLQKEYLEWGSGQNGKLILSDKAPSFPMIKLDINPVDWFSFSYFNGWLQSGIVDSNSIRKTLVEGRINKYDIPRFIVSHMFTFRPLKNLSISLGESVIYSDKIEPIYLIPFMFFRLADYYLSSDANSGDNVQLFADIFYVNDFLNTKFYSTIFIDEFSIDAILESKDGPSAVGYTFGFKSIDPIIPNSSFNLEYTRINPFVYMNSNDAQLYSSHGYELGHWIGSNSDQVFVQYTQGILRSLYITLWGEYTRKGQEELPEEQYLLPYPDFLYGDRLTQKRFGFKINYEPIHLLNVNLGYTYSEILDEAQNRFPDLNLGSSNRLSLSVIYGLR